MKKVSKFFIYFSLLFLYAGTLHAAEYVAFSLKVAQERIVSTPKGKDYRKLHPEVFTLGSITKIRGLVYDRKNKDVILVGERDPDRSILTLDDFVVALRARFIHGKWPLVSIDPAPETKKTNMQIVRFEGGIENTQFGQDLFDADYRLKKIGMGLLPSGVPGLKTYWDLGMERAKERSGGNHKIGSRFWFYPVLPSVTVRENVVAIRGLKVRVFTEVLSAEIDGKEIEDLSTFQDQTGDIFAKQISERFENLATVHPSFSRLQGLDELVALTKAIEEMDERPDLDWWLMEYQVKHVDTRKELKVLRRGEECRLPVSGGYYKGYWEVSGGVELMAIALRLKAGDVTALKEAVLKTRPKSNALTWSFVVGEWLIPTSPGMIEAEDIYPIFIQATFLQEKKHYEDAVTLYNKIIRLKPEHADAWRGKGYALIMLKKFREGMTGIDRALAINPNDPYVLIIKGALLDDMGAHMEAIKCFDRVLMEQPMFVEALGGKGVALFRLGRALGNKTKQEEGVNYLEKAIKIYPNHSEFWMLKAWFLYEMRDFWSALQSAKKAIQLNPYLAGAWFIKAECLVILREEEEASKSYTRFVELSRAETSTFPNPVWGRMIEQMLPK